MAHRLAGRIWLGSVNQNQLCLYLLIYEVLIMALLNSLLNSSASTASSTASQKKKGEVFLNVGFKLADPATNETVVVYLPFGIDLESMPSLNVSGSDENQIRNQLRNQLISELINEGKGLEPGSAKVFNPASIEVELRRKNSVKELKSDLKFAFKFN